MASAPLWQFYLFPFCGFLRIFATNFFSRLQTASIFDISPPLLPSEFLELVLFFCLAMRAIKCAAGGLDNSFDRRATGATGFSGAVVNAQSFFIKLLADGVGIKETVAIRAIVQRDGAAGVDGFEQGFANRVAQPRDLRRLQTPGGQLRRNLRAKKRFAGVDVADSGDHGLIEQFYFDGLRGALQRLGKAFDSEFVAEWFGAESLKAAGVQGHSPEITRVFEHKIFRAEVQHDGGMFRQRFFRGGEIHSAGHSEMADKRECLASASAHFKEQIFSPTGELNKRRAAQFARNFFGRGWQHDPRAANIHFLDFAPRQQRRQPPDKDFNFRKLGHAPTLIQKRRQENFFAKLLMCVFDAEQFQDFLVGGLGEFLVIRAYRPERGIVNETNNGIGDPLQLRKRIRGTNRNSHSDFSRALLFGRQHRGFHGRAGCQTVVHQHDRFAGNIQPGALMKLQLIFLQPLFFLLDNFGEFCARHFVRADGFFIEEHDVIFREGADGKFAMQRMANFPNDQHIEGSLQGMGNFRGDNHTAAWQTEDDVRFHSFMQQTAPQFLPGILTRCERHVHPSFDGVEKSTGENPRREAFLTDEGTDFFSHDDAFQIVRTEEVENDDRHLVVHAKREGSGIHDLQLLLQGVEIADIGKTFRLRIFLGIGIVDAVDLGGFEDDFGADFIGAQSGSGVSRKIRVAGAAAKDHHPALFQMAHCAAADEGFGNLRHGDGGLHTRGDAELFERVLQCERIDDRGEHAHVIASGAFNATLAAGQAAKDISAANDYYNLHAQLAHLADLLSHALDRLSRYADAGVAAEGFTAEFQQNPSVFRAAFFHCGFSVVHRGQVLTALTAKVKPKTGAVFSNSVCIQQFFIKLHPCIGFYSADVGGVFRFINGTLSNPFFDVLMPLASGNKFFFPALIAVGILLLWKGGKRGCLFLVMIALILGPGDGLVCNTIKRAIARPRPFVELEEVRLPMSKGRHAPAPPMVSEQTDAQSPENLPNHNSMPSSHAANWFAATMIAYVFYRRSWRFMLPLACLVSFSRIYNGVHYPTDVLAGACLGAGYAVAGMCAIESLWRFVGQRWFPLWWEQLPSLVNLKPAASEMESEELPPDTDTRHASTDVHWLRLGYIFIAVSLFANLAYLKSNLIGLSDDEAYQWVWSKHPALSYYSKPLMIALTQWLGTHLWGDTEFGV